jgi:hypothetical protein
MNLRSNGIRSNGVRSIGVSVKWPFGQNFSVKLFFGKAIQNLENRFYELRFVDTRYSSFQKYSNKHILNHNFFRLESFGLKFSGNLYIYLDQILAKNWKFWLQLYQTRDTYTYTYDTYVDFRLAKVFEQNKRPQALKV